MSESRPPVTFDEIKAAIGSLVLLWSRIEVALAAGVPQLPACRQRKAPHGISQSLEAWRLGVRGGPDRPLQDELGKRVSDHLREALKVRNLVCHGLKGIAAEGWEREAHLMVEERDGKRRTLTWGELDAMLRWLSRTPWVIDDLTAAALEKDAARAEALLRGWEAFPEQR